MHGGMPLHIRLEQTPGSTPRTRQLELRLYHCDEKTMGRKPVSGLTFTSSRLQAAPARSHFEIRDCRAADRVGEPLRERYLLPDKFAAPRRYRCAVRSRTG